MGLAWERGNNKPCALYLLSKPDTSPSPVAIVKSHGTFSKLLSCDYLTIYENVARWDAKEERNREKVDEFWLLSISNKILLW